MRRDIHLIRKILLRVEAADGILPVSQMEDLADLPTVARHVEWLAEAGLLKVEHLIPEAIDAAFDAIILRQTWQACEFLDAARDDDVWERTFQIISTRLHASASFELIQTILSQIVSHKAHFCESG